MLKLERVGIKAEDFAKFFDLVDEDGDGKLTMDEFARTVETLKQVAALGFAVRNPYWSCLLEKKQHRSRERILYISAGAYCIAHIGVHTV